MTNSVLHDEIMEQPTAIARLLDAEIAPVRALAQALSARHFDYLLIAARGTSDNAARYAQYLFGTALGLPVALATPSLHTLYGARLRFAGALVLGISQSGQSPDICAVLTDARAAGAPTIAITNDVDSPLARAAEHVIALHVGVEHSIAATKTYTAQLAALALLALNLAGDAAGLAALRTVPEALAATLALDQRMAEIAAHEHAIAAAVTISRGYNYATAWEIALKLKELAYVPTEPYSAADFQHGPIALVREHFPVLLIAPHGAASADLLALAQRLRGMRAQLLVISDVPELLATADEPIALPASVEERFSPLTAVLPGQLFALHFARARGLDPDHPRLIEKITETR